MKMKKIAIAASILALLSGTLVSCSSAFQNDTSQNSQSATEVKDSSQDVKLRSVGVTLGDLSNPFFVVMGKGAEQEAKKIGGDEVKVAVVSSGYDLNQQTNQMENCLTIHFIPAILPVSLDQAIHMMRIWQVILSNLLV